MNRALAARHVGCYIWRIMNAMTPISGAQPIDFRPAYLQLEQMERSFVDGFVSDVENIAERTGQRLLVVLTQPWPYEIDQRAAVLLSRPMVRAAISDRVRELSQLYDVSPYKTVKELTAIGYSNIANYYKLDEYGVPDFDLSKCTPEQLSAIKSYEIEDKPRGGRKVKFVLHDKIAGLTLLMRYSGLLNDAAGAAHYRDGMADETAGTLPKGIDHNAAADLYSRAING